MVAAGWSLFFLSHPCPPRWLGPPPSGAHAPPFLPPDPLQPLPRAPPRGWMWRPAGRRPGISRWPALGGKRSHTKAEALTLFRHIDVHQPSLADASSATSSSGPPWERPKVFKDEDPAEAERLLESPSHRPRVRPELSAEHNTSQLVVNCPASAAALLNAVCLLGPATKGVVLRTYERNWRAVLRVSLMARPTLLCSET